MPSQFQPSSNCSIRLTSNSTNSSNVNRFHGASISNFDNRSLSDLHSSFLATPVHCNSSSQAKSNETKSYKSNVNFRNTISSNTLLKSSSQYSNTLLDLSSKVPSDLAVVAAAYDLASLHSSRFNPTNTLSQSSSSDYHSSISNQACSNGSFNLTNTALTTWEEAHQAGSTFSNCHYHNFAKSCDFINTLNLSEANFLPCGSIPNMAISRISNQSSSGNQGISESESGFQINRLSVKANTNKHSKSRRRVATMAQRRAANIRERRRMFHLNTAFDKLRKKVPTFAYEKRLSRIETLRLAIMYISFMTEILKDFKDNQPRIPLHPNSASFNHQLYNIWETSISFSDSNGRVAECGRH